MITIVDYGMGNLGSIQNILKRIGIKSNIESCIDKIQKAKKLILPGVGSFDRAMRKINEGDLRQVLNNLVLIDGVPVLGICLGMQIMSSKSEEGQLNGLNWIPAITKKLITNKHFKVPQMGWNFVEKTNNSPLNAGINSESKFYFAHSYYVQVKYNEHSILKTNYILNFDSGIQKDNIFGVQFHPEKSQKTGQILFRNFLSIS